MWCLGVKVAARGEAVLCEANREARGECGGMRWECAGERSRGVQVRGAVWCGVWG